MEIISTRLIPILKACLLFLLLLFSSSPHSFEKLLTQNTKEPATEKAHVDNTFLSARSSISSEIDTQVSFLLEEISLPDTRIEDSADYEVISPSIVPLALFRFDILSNAPWCSNDLKNFKPFRSKTGHYFLSFNEIILKY